MIIKINYYLHAFDCWYGDFLHCPIGSLIPRLCPKCLFCRTGAFDFDTQSTDISPKHVVVKLEAFCRICHESKDIYMYFITPGHGIVKLSKTKIKYNVSRFVENDLILKGIAIALPYPGI